MSLPGAVTAPIEVVMISEPDGSRNESEIKFNPSRRALKRKRERTVKVWRGNATEVIRSGLKSKVIERKYLHDGEYWPEIKRKGRDSQLPSDEKRRRVLLTEDEI